MILNEFFNLPQVFEKDMTEGNGRDLTNTPRDQFISRMAPSMDANALRQKVAKIVNSPGFTADTILQIVDAGDNLSHPAGRYIQQAFYGLQYNLGKEYEDYPERVAEKLLSQFRSMLPAYRVTEADEWEEDTEKRERFLKYAKQKLMASNGNIEMAAALSQQDNKIFGSPFLNDPAAQQAPAGAVSIIDNRPYTRAIAQIMAYIESKQGQAEISATQAALWLTPQGKKFLERVSTDLYGIDDNAARKKHAIALSGYQVQHLGGKITGSYYGPDDFHSAEQNMTKEVAAIYDLVTLELEREAGIEGDARERQKDMAFWNAIPYPLKVVMCASLGKTPGQMESILFGTEADMLASHFGNKKPKPNADPTPAEPKKLGETGIDRAVNDKGLTQQRWLQLVQTKFPDAKIVQAKMIDGPCRATLPDGRTLSWVKAEQGVAEGMFGSRPSPVLPIVAKIDRVAGGLTPQNVETGKQIIQANARDIIRMLSPQAKAGVDVIEQGVAEAKGDYVPPREADYGPEYQAMVKRVGQKAKQQEKAKQQQPKAPVRESRKALLKQIIQS